MSIELIVAELVKCGFTNELAESVAPRVLDLLMGGAE